MIVVNVIFKTVEIGKYVRNAPITLKITFDDGYKERSFEKVTSVENAEALTQEVINDVRKMEKEAHTDTSGGFLDDVVIVRFGDDEEKTEAKLQNTFRRIKEELMKLKTMTTAQDYLQRIAMFQKSKYNI